MSPLTIFWNELSLPSNLVQEDFAQDGQWAERAGKVYEALHHVWRVQPRARVAMTKGQFHAYIFGQPIFSWLELWLGKDRVRSLKGTKLIQMEDENGPLINEFDCEVSIENVVGEGITRAHIANTWVWSLGVEFTATDTESIKAQESRLDDGGTLVSQEVAIPNLADKSHFTYWEDEIAAWGQVESENCIIGHVSGNIVLMYPFDHGYPHVHVKVTDRPQYVYKYRVDLFEPLADSNETLEVAMRDWVLVNSGSLNESWRRCKRGKHPLKIV